MAAKKIDWFNVLMAYLIDEKRSVRDVAKMFNLSYYSVRNKSQRDSWLQERTLLHHRARDKMRRMMTYKEAKAEVIQKALSGEVDIEKNHPTLG